MVVMFVFAILCALSPPPARESAGLTSTVDAFVDVSLRTVPLLSSPTASGYDDTPGSIFEDGSPCARGLDAVGSFSAEAMLCRAIDG